jgi:hypothetical protein
MLFLLVFGSHQCLALFISQENVMDSSVASLKFVLLLKYTRFEFCNFLNITLEFNTCQNILI